LQTRYYDVEVGRFVNADSIEYLDLETINGCNLYAYGLNNPIAFADPYGCAPNGLLWPGEIHAAVQEHILVHLIWYRPKFQLEVALYIGRIDMVDWTTMEIWEVKPHKPNYYWQALCQMLLYKQAAFELSNGVFNFSFGSNIIGGVVPSTFLHTSDNGKTYLVTLFYYYPGVIMYEYVEIDDEQKSRSKVPSPVPVPVPKREKSKGRNWSWAPAPSRQTSGGSTVLFVAMICFVAFGESLLNKKRQGI